MHIDTPTIFSLIRHISLHYASFSCASFRDISFFSSSFHFSSSSRQLSPGSIAAFFAFAAARCQLSLRFSFFHFLRAFFFAISQTLLPLLAE
jgi:hypothetical protein